ncbi:DNA helicase [Weissella phage WCP30]|uniref:DNA helicase n=1 Tax=Weissella phage WCP30 TaxID=1837862 RepID=UPI0008110EAC|nr:DNA helicase [Weissella phage WCP30]ANU78871.1 DNA helicase [Weissella phage WCP30]
MLDQEKRAKLHLERNAAVDLYRLMSDVPAQPLFESIKDNAFYTPHQLITIGARPDVGKTVMAMHIAKTQLLNGHTVAYFGLEEEAGELYLNMDEYVPTERAENFIVRSFEYTEINSFVAEVQFLHKEYEVDFIVLDQLSLLDVDDTPEIRAKFDKVQRRLQVLTKELEITILQITQLGRGVSEQEEMPENFISESDRIFQNSKWLGIFSKFGEIDETTREFGMRIRKSKKRNGRYANYIFKFDYASSIMFDVKEYNDDDYFDAIRGNKSKGVSGGNRSNAWY